MKQFLIALALAALAALPAQAQEKVEGAVGYGGSKVQMHPMMVPVRNSAGQIRFEVLTLRIVLDTGPKERPACFSVPIVHEKMLMYLYHAKLKPEDLQGQQKRDLLAKNLLNVAVKTTERGYYSGIELVNIDDPGKQALDPKSQTLSSQCK